MEQCFQLYRFVMQQWCTIERDPLSLAVADFAHYPCALGSAIYRRVSSQKDFVK